jgi:hypothetical protein
MMTTPEVVRHLGALPGVLETHRRSVQRAERREHPLTRPRASGTHALARHRILHAALGVTFHFTGKSHSPDRAIARQPFQLGHPSEFRASLAIFRDQES